LKSPPEDDLQASAMAKLSEPTVGQENCQQAKSQARQQHDHETLLLKGPKNKKAASRGLLVGRQKGRKIELSTL
jgi:hypothetical protein